MYLPESELKLMELIWENAPLKSGELSALARDRLGWKKSTVYTVIKKLTEKGAIVSENAVITPTVSRQEIMAESSVKTVSNRFGGSLSMFVSAFLGKEKITKEEAEELKRLIDSYTED